MPYQKKDKDGKVVEEFGTREPTAEQAQKNKQDRIAEQNKSREKFEEDRKKSKPETSAKAPLSSAPGSGAGSNSKSAAS